MPLVTVFGSLHYDVMVSAPAQPRTGETVAGHSWRPKCGGKGGNQAVAAARAGAMTAMIGAVGDDAFGHALLANLDRAGVDRRFVRVESGAATGMSVAISDDDGDYGAVIVSGVNLSLSRQDVVAASDVISATAMLVLQNEVPDAANLAAAQAVKTVGGRVLFNAAPARLPSAELASCVDFLVVNAVEAEMLVGGGSVETLDAAMSAARKLAERYPCAIVTAGGAGVACAFGDGTGLTVEAIRVDVASTHGAGDEFIGFLAASLAGGQSMDSALRHANRAAARLVATPEADRG